MFIGGRNKRVRTNLLASTMCERQAGANSALRRGRKGVARGIKRGLHPRDVRQGAFHVLPDVVDVLPLRFLNRGSDVVDGDLSLVEQVLNDEHGR